MKPLSGGDFIRILLSGYKLRQDHDVQTPAS